MIVAITEIIAAIEIGEGTILFLNNREWAIEILTKGIETVEVKDRLRMTKLRQQRLMGCMGVGNEIRRLKLEAMTKAEDEMIKDVMIRKTAATVGMRMVTTTAVKVRCRVDGKETMPVIQGIHQGRRNETDLQIEVNQAGIIPLNVIRKGQEETTPLHRTEDTEDEEHRYRKNTTCKQITFYKPTKELYRLG